AAAPAEGVPAAAGPAGRLDGRGCCMGYEEDRVPLVRPLVAIARLADAHRRGGAAAVHRAGGRGRGTRGRRGVLPGAPLRPAAGVPLPPAGRGWGPDEP